jgi:nicotinate-nucleotide adenylyltransferase
MRIGIFGGTFNPVHLGHIRVATEVTKAFGLDRCYLVPSALPPHKDPSRIADSRDRIEMLRMAVKNHPVLKVSDVELRRVGPSYTIDTVRHFTRKWKTVPDIFLIMGSDAFLEIETWKSSVKLFELVPMVVVSRPGANCATSDSIVRALERKLHSHISKAYRYSEKEAAFHHRVYKPVYLSEIRALDISSTLVRELVAAGKPLEGIVPDGVSQYIDKKGLYR